MGNASSVDGLETWKPNSQECDCRCASCQVILVCELVACMGQHTYAFMKQALGKETVTISATSGVGAGPDGATYSGELGRSVQVEKGEWLITYLRKKGSQHMCTDCFRKAFPTDFAGILLTSVGKAKVINSQYQWLEMSYGTTE